MTRVAWLTDIHLNFLEADELNGFLGRVRAAGPEAIFLTGDVAEAHDVGQHLELLDDAFEVPIYFVLGNHDFYRGSIAGVRHTIAALAARRPRLCYLTMQDRPVPLTPRTAVVGHDGWADARLGDYERSTVMMNDYRLIAELTGVGKQQRWPLLRALGDEAAAHLRAVLPAALEQYEEVFVLTHVPPWREACWHEGRHSDDEWAPHFTCQATGEAILEIAGQYPHRQVTVLCGHTHGAGEARLLPNLAAFTGGAEYGQPQVQRMLGVR